MIYNKIIFNSVPIIVFAHKYKTLEYKLSLLNYSQRNCIEIAYIDYGELTYLYEDGEKIIVPENSIHTFYHDRKIVGSSNGKPHCHLTIGLAGDFKIQKVSSPLQETKKDNVIIFPEVITDFQLVNKMKKSISEIVSDCLGNSNSLKNTSKIFELFYEATSFSTNKMGDSENKSFSNILYCRKATEYISANIKRRIKVSEIAEYVGISEGYLQRVFKESTDHSIVDYINMTKINIAIDLILEKNITVSEIAAQVGISDEKYFCRLFKKYTGMTLSEYKQIDKNRLL